MELTWHKTEKQWEDNALQMCFLLIAQVLLRATYKKCNLLRSIRVHITSLIYITKFFVGNGVDMTAKN